tara:strand:- start:40 stop:423 length:384 start_codon:yes stop_codon:yes gene_type:complete
MSEPIRVSDALVALRPGAEWNITGNVYEGIEWLDKNQSLPTEEQVTAKMKELTDAKPMKLLREERNKRIAETDWTQLKDIDLDIIRERNWKNYRQALRDLPAKSNPKLNEYGDLDMTSVSWPDKPST